MKNKYDMEEFAKQVEVIVRSCVTCQTSKTYTGATKETIINLVSKQPFDDIYIDFCGPLPVTKGKKYILGIIDRFSRYIVLTAVSNQDEATVMNTIQQKWIFRFGAPGCIHVDRGKVFESQRFLEYARSMLIEIRFSSP